MWVWDKQRNNHLLISKMIPKSIISFSISSNFRYIAINTPRTNGGEDYSIYILNIMTKKIDSKSEISNTKTKITYLVAKKSEKDIRYVDYSLSRYGVMCLFYWYTIGKYENGEKEKKKFYYSKFYDRIEYIFGNIKFRKVYLSKNE